MVELKTLELEQFRFIQITLFLPHWTCRMIACTRGVLVDESWDLKMLESRNMAAFQTHSAAGEKMLEEKITAVTSIAADLGIYIGMSGKEALLRVMNEKTKEG